TLTILRRACSIAFCTATGTSFALPLPMPTRPSPSPTTVSAAKPRIRPPFTTFVTRLMLIIFSRRPSPRSSCCCCRCCILAMSFLSLELQAGFAGRVGQRLDAAVIAVARAIECHGLDAERLRAVADALADDRRGRLVAAVLDLLAELGFGGRRARQHAIAFRRDDLRVDVAVRPAHHEPRRAGERDADPRLAGAADAGLVLVHRMPLIVFSKERYFFLVSLIFTYSFAYRTPLPL